MATPTLSGSKIISAKTLTLGSEIVIKSIVVPQSVADPAESFGYRVYLTVGGGSKTLILDALLNPIVTWNIPFEADRTMYLETIITVLDADSVIVSFKWSFISLNAGFFFFEEDQPSVNGLLNFIDLGDDMLITPTTIDLEASLPQNLASNFKVCLTSIRVNKLI